jgi:hypothetical protein
VHNLFRHIVFAFAAATLALAGCSKQALPGQDGAEIDFSASAVRLETATKSGASLVEGTQFDVDDEIQVSAWHHRKTELVFVNETVKKTAADAWSYSPKKKWRWEDSDYYDFFAFYAAPAGPGVTATPANGEPFSLSVDYDATELQYDLMMAGTRHKISDSNPSRVVDLNFQHMLSAVKVIFYKYIGGEAVVITSYHFMDLVVSADVQGFWDDGYKRFDSRLTNTLRLDTELFGEDRISPWGDPDNYLRDSTTPYDPGFFDLLLPQDLDPDSGAPSLVVRYMDETDKDPDDGIFLPSEYTSERIPLKNIPVKGTTDQFITRWEPGHKYIYEVHILFNGGVLVNVVSTEWDEVPAQTPGLMI